MLPPNDFVKLQIKDVFFQTYLYSCAISILFFRCVIAHDETSLDVPKDDAKAKDITDVMIV